MITFRVGATDAEVFEKEFAPYFTMDDIVNLSAYQMYLRLMIDGVGSKPFSAKALPPIEPQAKSFASNVIDYSRKKYGRNKEEVAREIQIWYEPIAKPEVLRDTKKQEVRQDPKPEPKKESRDEVKKDFHADQPKKREPKKDTYHKEVVKTEKPKEEILFDNKPSMSLKDALKKALEEDKTVKENKEASTTNSVQVEETVKKESVPTKNIVKEVAEDRLKELIYGDEL
jgi:hypothetical protein